MSKKLTGEVLINNGRNAKTSFIIIDAQSVKNTDTAKEKGYDAGKKVSGIKRHIAVDTKGLPHAIAITTAKVTDRTGAIMMITKNKENLSGVKSSLVMAVIPESLLQKRSKNYSEQLLRLLNAANFTNLPLFQSVG